MPAGLDALGGGREAGAPWVTRVLLVTLAIRANVAPAIPQRRGVEDAAPYGRLLNRTMRHMTQRVRKTVPKQPAHFTAPLKHASRNHRRGRRPRRPFRWMTDDVGLLLNATIHVVGRTVLGAPPLVDRRRRFRAPTSPHVVGAGFHARPAWVDWQRYYAAPTLHQPLSHAASRRDSSPFRGAEGWAEVCGVCASVCRDADAYVPLIPVRGGVLDAPRSCDRRGGLDASVRRALLHPRYPRRSR